jgi:hypothetical protein
VIGMSIFKPVFVAETKELYIKRNLLILFVFFLMLILFLQDGIMAGKKIIYLNTEMYYTKVSLDKKIKVEDTVTFPLFIDKITVR